MPGERVLDDTEQRQILDYVMADQPNRLDRLELAVGVYAAFEAIREAVIRQFIGQLADRVAATLRREEGWNVDAASLLDQPKGKGAVTIRSETWMDGVSVKLQADADGPRGWWLGVETLPGCAIFEIITKHLSEKLGEAKTDPPQYPWWRNFEGRWKNWTLADWRQPQAVLAIGEGATGLYGKYLRESLVEIATALHEKAGKET
jgi:hypothetical protein